MLVWTGAAIELPVSISKTAAMLNETVSCEKPVRKKLKEVCCYIRENFNWSVKEWFSLIANKVTLLIVLQFFEIG